MSHTRFKPTDKQRELVRKMAAYGLTHDQIAACISWADGTPISPTMLATNFERELSTGLAMAITDSAECVMNIVRNGQDERARLDAAKYFLSTRGKWRTADSIAATDAAQKQLISEGAKRPGLLEELKRTMEQASAQAYKQIEREVIDVEK